MRKILYAPILFALAISSCGSKKAKTKGWTREQIAVYSQKIDLKKQVSVVLNYEEEAYYLDFDMKQGEDPDPAKGEEFNKKYSLILEDFDDSVVVRRSINWYRDNVFRNTKLTFFTGYATKKETQIYPVPDLINTYGYSAANNLIMNRTLNNDDPLELKVRTDCVRPELILLAYNYHYEVYLSGYSSSSGGGSGSYEQGDIIEIPPTGIPGEEKGTLPKGPEPEPDPSSTTTSTSQQSGSDERGPAELQPKKGIHRFIQNTYWDFDNMQTSYKVGTPFSAQGLKAIAKCMDYSEDYSYIDYVDLDVTKYVKYECIEVVGDGIDVPLEYVIYDEPPCNEEASRRLRFWVDVMIDGWQYEKSPHLGLINEVTIDFIYIYFSE